MSFRFESYQPNFSTGDAPATDAATPGDAAQFESQASSASPTSWADLQNHNGASSSGMISDNPFARFHASFDGGMDEGTQIVRQDESGTAYVDEASHDSSAARAHSSFENGADDVQALSAQSEPSNEGMSGARFAVVFGN